MRKIFLLTSAVFLLFACKKEEKPIQEQIVPNHEIAFDSKKWKEPSIYLDDEDTFPYREKMLNDLVDSKLLKGKSRSETLELLGKPSRTDKEYLFYTVYRNEAGFITLKVRTLVLVLSGAKETDTVQKVLIHN